MSAISQEALETTLNYVYGIKSEKMQKEEGWSRKVVGDILIAQLTVRENNKFSLVSLPVDKMIEAVEDGLPISVFREVCKILDLSEKDLSKIIRLPISTLAKRKNRGYFSSTESERIVRLMELYKKAVKIFDDKPEYARKWFKEPAKGLGGATPLEYAKTEVGAREAENLLIRIDEGVFT